MIVTGKRAAFYLLVVFSLPVFSQPQQISSPAKTLMASWKELQGHPNDPVVQERYLDAFPHDYESFLSLFDTGRELNDGYDYISVLPSLAEIHESEVGKLLVTLSVDAKWKGDASSYLQHATAVYGGHHSRAFAGLLKTLSSAQRSRLIRFLADVENQGAYKEYQEIIDQLQGLGESELARQFESVREIRSRQPHG